MIWSTCHRVPGWRGSFLVFRLAMWSYEGRLFTSGPGWVGPLFLDQGARFCEDSGVQRGEVFVYINPRATETGGISKKLFRSCSFCACWWNGQLVAGISPSPFLEFWMLRKCETLKSWGRGSRRRTLSPLALSTELMNIVATAYMYIADLADRMQVYLCGHCIH